MRRFFFSLFWLGLVGLPAAGQSLRDTVHIREVQVLGRRRVEEAGLTVTRPDSLAMVSGMTTDLSQLISQYTPVFIKSYGRGSAATANFRGTAASHTQVVWNGMNLNSPMRGSADLSLLPVFFVDEAFLLHGGSSLTEGSGALGGSIHLGNKPDWAARKTVAAVAERGSFNSGKYLGRWQLGGSRFKSVSRIYYEDSDNRFSFYNVGVIPYRRDTLENAGYYKAGVLQEFYFRFSEEKIAALRGWYQQSHRNLPQLMSYEGSDREEYQDDDHFRAQFELKNYGGPVQYQFFSGANFTRLHYFRQSPDLKFVNDDSNSRENSFSNRLKLQRKFSSKIMATASLDVNYHQVEVVNRVRETGYDASRLETGLLLNVQVKAADRLAMFVLSRAESYDSRLIPFIPAVGAEWQLLPAFPLFLKTNLSRNYHKPSLNDLYWLPGGNPDLLPEDGISTDWALTHESQTPGAWKQELSFFISKINNWIIWQPASNGAYYWEAANVKEVLSRGLEYQFNGKAAWQKWVFHFSGNYAYTRTTNQHAVSSVDQSRGRQLIYIPKHSGNLHLTAAFQRWSLQYDLGYTGRRYTQSSNEWTHFESVLNPFWLSTASLQKQWEFPALTVSAKVMADNLLGADYQRILWRPMPGRNYLFTLGFSWKK